MLTHFVGNGYFLCYFIMLWQCWSFLFQLLGSVDNHVKTPFPDVVPFPCFVCWRKLSNDTLCDAINVTTLE